MLQLQETLFVLTRTEPMWRPTKLLLRLALALASLSFLVAYAQNAELAGVRFVHLSPDTPLVDFILDEQAQQRDIEFGYVTSYFWLTPGRHEVTVYPHRAAEQSAALDMLDLQNVLSNEDAPAPKIAPLEPFRIAIDLIGGVYYTVALAGFYTPPSATSELSSLSLELEPGTSVRVIGPRSYLLTLETSETLQSLEPGQYTVDARRSGFKDVRYEVTLTAGERALLGITLEGDISVQTPDESTLTETVPSPSWQRAQLYTFEDSYSSLPAPGQAQLRVVHAAPGIPSLELRLAELPVSDGATSEAVDSDVAKAQTLIQNVSFPTSTNYVNVKSGEHMIELVLAGSDFSVMSLPAELSSGAMYTFYLGSSLSGEVLTPVPSIDAVLRVPLTK